MSQTSSIQVFEQIILFSIVELVGILRAEMTEDMEGGEPSGEEEEDCEDQDWQGEPLVSTGCWQEDHTEDAAHQTQHHRQPGHHQPGHQHPALLL